MALEARLDAVEGNRKSVLDLAASFIYYQN